MLSDIMEFHHSLAPSGKTVTWNLQIPKIGALGMSKEKQVLQLDPATKLSFRGPFTDETSATLKLTNPSDMRVFFKTISSHPKLYCFRPNSGVVEPTSTVHVRVRLRPFAYDPSQESKHFFVVYSTIGSWDYFIEEYVWRVAKPEDVMFNKLQCFFELPTDAATQEVQHCSSPTPIIYTTFLESPQIFAVDRNFGSYDNSAKAVQKPKKKQVLQLEPSAELRFRGPFTNEITSILKLTNPSSKRVFFKIKSPAAGQYGIRPNNGVVEPKSHIDIEVTLRPFNYDSNKKSEHTIVVYSLSAPTNGVVQETVWRYADTEAIMDSELKCIFDLPTERTVQGLHHCSSPTTSTFTSNLEFQQIFVMEQNPGSCDIVAKYVQRPKKKQVLQLEPAAELRFRGPFTNEITSILKLTNPSNKRVFFKTKSPAAGQYGIRPNNGVVEAKSHIDIEVTLRPFDYDPNKKIGHTIIVYSLIAPTNDVVQETVWRYADAEEIMDSELKCIFDLPTELRAQAIHHHLIPEMKTTPNNLGTSKSFALDPNPHSFGSSMQKVKNGTMEHLLQLQPSDELRFRGPFTDETMSTLKLINPSDMRIFFKTNSSHPDLYCVRPNNGLVEPKSTVDLSVKLRPLHCDPSKEKDHFFVVHSTCAFADHVVQENVWKIAQTSDVTVSKLQCIFELHTDNAAQEVQHCSSPTPIIYTIFLKSPKIFAVDQNFGSFDNSAKAVQKPKKKQVLQLEPAAELRFRGPFTDEVTSILKLTNPSSKRVFFKTKSPAAGQYGIRPNNGVVEPKSHIDIEVTLRPFNYDSNKKSEHTIIVYSLSAPTNGVVQETVWRYADTEAIMDSELKCIFDLPAERTVQAIHHRLIPEMKTIHNNLDTSKSFALEPNPHSFGSSMQKVRNGTMEHLLQLQPSDELRFRGPFTDEIMSTLKLINPSDMRIFFKTNSSHPDLYCVRPNNGLVEPKSTVDLAVRLRPLHCSPSKEKDHFFVVHSTCAFADHVVQENVWKIAHPNDVTISKLECVFELQTDNAVQLKRSEYPPELVTNDDFQLPLGWNKSPTVSCDHALLPYPEYKAVYNRTVLERLLCDLYLKQSDIQSACNQLDRAQIKKCEILRLQQVLMLRNSPTCFANNEDSGGYDSDICVTLLGKPDKVQSSFLNSPFITCDYRNLPDYKYKAVYSRHALKKILQQFDVGKLCINWVFKQMDEVHLKKGDVKQLKEMLALPLAHMTVAEMQHNPPSPMLVALQEPGPMPNLLQQMPKPVVHQNAMLNVQQSQHLDLQQKSQCIPQEELQAKMALPTVPQRNLQQSSNQNLLRSLQSILLNKSKPEALSTPLQSLPEVQHVPLQNIQQSPTQNLQRVSQQKLKSAIEHAPLQEKPQVQYNRPLISTEMQNSCLPTKPEIVHSTPQNMLQRPRPNLLDILTKIPEKDLKRDVTYTLPRKTTVQIEPSHKMQQSSPKNLFQSPQCVPQHEPKPEVQQDLLMDVQPSSRQDVLQSPKRSLQQKTTPLQLYSNWDQFNRQCLKFLESQCALLYLCSQNLPLDRKNSLLELDHFQRQLNETILQKVKEMAAQLESTQNKILSQKLALQKVEIEKLKQETSGFALSVKSSHQGESTGHLDTRNSNRNGKQPRDASISSSDTGAEHPVAFSFQKLNEEEVSRLDPRALICCIWQELGAAQPHSFQDRVMASPCVLTETLKWAKPSEVRVRLKGFEELFTNVELETVFNKEFVYQRMADVSVYGLGCHHLSPTEALAILNDLALSAKIKEPKWFLTLYRFFGSRLHDVSELLEEVFQTKMFPLASGTVSSLQEGRILILKSAPIFQIGEQVLRLLALDFTGLAENDLAYQFLDAVGICPATPLDIANSIVTYHCHLPRPVSGCPASTNLITLDQLWEQLRFLKENWLNVGQMFPRIEVCVMVPVDRPRAVIADEKFEDLTSAAEADVCYYHYAKFVYMPFLRDTFAEISPTLSDSLNFLDDSYLSNLALQTDTKEWNQFLTVKLGVNRCLRLCETDHKVYEPSEELNLAIKIASSAATLKDPAVWGVLLRHLQTNWNRIKQSSSIINCIRNARSGHGSYFIYELFPALHQYKDLLLGNSNKPFLDWPAFDGLTDKAMLNDLGIDSRVTTKGLMKLERYLKSLGTSHKKPSVSLDVWKKLYAMMKELNMRPEDFVVCGPSNKFSFVRCHEICLDLPSVFHGWTDLVPFPASDYAGMPDIRTWFKPTLYIPDLIRVLGALLKTENPSKEEQKDVVMECYRRMDELLAKKLNHRQIPLVLDSRYLLRGKNSTCLLVMPDRLDLYNKFAENPRGVCPVKFVHPELVALPNLAKALGHSSGIPLLSEVINVSLVKTTWRGYFVMSPGRYKIKVPTFLSASLTNMYRAVLAEYLFRSGNTLERTEKIALGNVIRATYVYVCAVAHHKVHIAYTVHGVSKSVQEHYFIHTTMDGQKQIIVPPGILSRRLEEQVDLFALKELFPSLVVDDYLKTVIGQLIVGSLKHRLDSNHVLASEDEKKTFAFEINVEDCEAVQKTAECYTSLCHGSLEMPKRQDYQIYHTVPRITDQRAIPGLIFQKLPSSRRAKSKKRSGVCDAPNGSRGLPELGRDVPVMSCEESTACDSALSSQDFLRITGYSATSQSCETDQVGSHALDLNKSSTPTQTELSAVLPLSSEPLLSDLKDGAVSVSKRKKKKLRSTLMDDAEPVTDSLAVLQRIRSEVLSWPQSSVRAIEARLLNGGKLKYNTLAYGSVSLSSDLLLCLQHLENEEECGKWINLYAQWITYNHLLDVCKERRPLLEGAKYVSHPLESFTVENWVSPACQYFGKQPHSRNKDLGFDFCYRQLDGLVVHIKVKGHATYSNTFHISLIEWQTAKKLASSTNKVYVILGVDLNVLSMEGAQMMYLLENPIELKTCGTIVCNDFDSVVQVVSPPPHDWATECASPDNNASSSSGMGKSTSQSSSHKGKLGKASTGNKSRPKKKSKSDKLRKKEMDAARSAKTAEANQTVD